MIDCTDTVHRGMQPLLQSQLLPQLPQNSRTNLNVLKSQIAKRLGAERAQCYFSSLNGLLSQKLSKSEFNKLCLLTLGRENLPLHNHLVRSILRNVCHAKTPPPIDHEKCVQKPTKTFLKQSLQIDYGFNSLRIPTSLPISISYLHLLASSGQGPKIGLSMTSKALSDQMEKQRLPLIILY